MNEENQTSIDQLAAEYWDYILDTSPTMALMFGDYRNVASWEDVSFEGEAAQADTLRSFADRAARIDPASLSPERRITRSMLTEEAGQGAIALDHSATDYGVDPSGGFHVTLLQMAGQIPVPNEDVADALCEKWSGFGRFFDDVIARLREGRSNGRVASRTAITKTVSQLESYLASPLDADPYITVPAPVDMGPAAADEWRAQLRNQVESTIRPGYNGYLEVLRDELLPDARPDDRCGLMWLEDGVEAYQAAIRRYTTLDLGAEEIHAIGMEEIERLGDEYRELGSRVLGTSDLDEIYDRLRNDPDLRFEDAGQVRDAAQATLDRARTTMGDWFGRLPQSDCDLVALDGPGAEEAPLGYYLQPALDGSRPGTYFVNVTQPTTRTRYESEPLAVHESIPGHHLQIAIAQELDDVPEFQRHAYSTAYVEGWGLYTERLGDEMGLYTGDLARLGVLSFDSWRSGRLVVDTGIHALGWSRQQAIDFLMANSPQALNNMENEVDRYIAWPGQALAYKMGQRQILRLRAQAESRLGDAFDIKGFHDVVLGSGAVTLELLDDLVSDWMER